jgi:hypothetical protein
MRRERRVEPDGARALKEGRAHDPAMLRRAWAVTVAVFAALGSGCGSTRPATTALTPTSPSVKTSAASQRTAATPPRTGATPQGAAAQRAPGPPDGPVPRAFRVRSVTFVSQRTGWVLGTAPCATAPCTSVLRTRDSGRTWHGIPAPRVGLTSPASSRGVSELRFADARDGWAFGPQLWATHDGGVLWRRVRIGSVEALAASAGHAIAIVRSGTRIRILRAAAAGDAWRPVASFGGAGAVQGPALALSAGSAWLADPAGLELSADGVHWTTATGPCRTAAGVAAAWLTSATRGIVVCGGEGAAGSEEKAVYGSATAGRSFTLLGRAPRGGDLEAASANRHETVIVAAASGASELYGSFDGGRTWSTVLGLDDGGLGWGDLGFTTNAQGVAVESSGPTGRLFMTRDGGRRWRVVRFAAG